MDIFPSISPYLCHQELKSTLGLHDACDSINALFETALAVSGKDFLLKVSDLCVPGRDCLITTSDSLGC